MHRQFLRPGMSTRASWSWSSARSSGEPGRCAARVDDVRAPGEYITCELARRRADRRRARRRRSLRAFYNVCRHHAAAVVTDAHGSATQFRCPYHGWTYALDGSLKGTPDFAGVCDFDRSAQRPRAHRVRRRGEVGIREARPRRRRASRAFLGPALTTPSRRRAALDVVALDGAASLHARLQLEGVRRQLSRWRLSRAARAQGSRQRARVHASTRSKRVSASVCSGVRWSAKGRTRAPEPCDKANAPSTTGSIRTS